MGLRDRRSPRLALGAIAGIVLLGLGALAASTLSGDRQHGSSPPPGASAASAPRGRAELCEDIEPGRLADAIGPDTVLQITEPGSCTVTRTGTDISVTVDLLDALADEADLDAVRRSSGTSAQDLDPWPSEPLHDLGDGARWLADPSGDDTTGELYLLDANRLIRIAVTTPPDYRRTPRSLATALAPLLIDG